MNELVFTKKSELFNKLHFVLSARSLSDIRPVLQCLNVTEKELQCTDGFRLHIASTESGLESGLYEVVKYTKSLIILKLTKNKDAKYPDTSTCIPITQDSDFVTPKSLHLIDNCLFYAAQRNYLVRHTYILDAIPQSASDVQICVPLGKKVPAILTHSLGKAIVMGIDQEGVVD